MSIFSNKGDRVEKNGSGYWKNGKGYVKNGDAMFGTDGSSSIKNGNTIFGGPQTGGRMNTIGNTIHTDNDTYTLIGDMLTGINGKTWYGVSSIEEAEDILRMEMGEQNNSFGFTPDPFEDDWE